MVRLPEYVKGNADLYCKGCALEPIITFKGIKKYFPGTKALDWDPQDTMEVYPGEIHGLVGENGAGKSTLLQVLMGIYTRTDGEIIYKGNAFIAHNALEAEDHGISIIMQQPNFAHNMNVAENIFINRSTKFKNAIGFLNLKRQHEAARKVLDDLGYDHIETHSIVGQLSFEERKQVEIARAFSSNPKVLLVDETSAAVSKESVEELYQLIRKKRDEGIAVIYISHFIDEIHDLCDRVTILRDGKLVAKLLMDESVTEDVIIRNMVGRDVNSSSYRASEEGRKTDEVILQTKRLSGGRHQMFMDVDLKVHRGEIVGIAGIGGSGSSEFGHALFGNAPITHGEILYKGEKIKFHSPSEAIRSRVGYLPKDRDREGLIVAYDLVMNISQANLWRMHRYSFIEQKQERAIAEDSIKNLRIKTPSAKTKVTDLSGGNRQKVAISKWTANESDFLILNSPTRGVDVGAKYEIYRIIEHLKNENKGILLISDELPELIGMCDRIYSFRNGMVSGEFIRGENFSEEVVVATMV